MPKVFFSSFQKLGITKNTLTLLIATCSNEMTLAILFWLPKVLPGH